MAYKIVDDYGFATDAVKKVRFMDETYHIGSDLHSFL